MVSDARIVMRTARLLTWLNVYRFFARFTDHLWKTLKNTCFFISPIRKSLHHSAPLSNSCKISHCFSTRVAMFDKQCNNFGNVRPNTGLCPTKSDLKDLSNWPCSQLARKTLVPANKRRKSLCRRSASKRDTITKKHANKNTNTMTKSSFLISKRACKKTM